ncbi:MAG: hypothetical protein ABL997_09330 [Planctomycetota bacterium]
MLTLCIPSRFVALVLAAANAVLAQQETEPPRYVWKAGDTHWFEIEKSLEAPRTSDPTLFQGKSSIRFVVELAIGKAKAKGEGFEASYVVRRIVSESDSPSGGEKLTYDSDTGDRASRLANTFYPQELAEIVGQPFKLWIDDRGGLHELKPPKVARSKDVERILGTSGAAGLFGLCVPQLPAKALTAEETWSSQVDMTLSKDEPLVFDVTNKLTASEDGSVQVEQNFVPKKAEQATLELLEGKGTGGRAKDGAMLERKLDLSIKGRISMMGAQFEGKMGVRVATTAAWTPPKKRK